MELLIIVFGLLVMSDVGQSCGLSSACCKRLETKVDALTDIVENFKDDMGSQSITAGAETTPAMTTTAALETTSAALTTLDPLKECRDLGGMIYESACYFSLEGSYNFDDAISACGNMADGATLAPVTTNELFEALQMFLRKIVVAEDKEYIAWGVGLKYDLTGHHLTTLDGTTVTWNGRWYSTAFPMDESNRTTVKMDVAGNPSDSNGFWNTPPHVMRRPLCMI